LLQNQPKAPCLRQGQKEKIPIDVYCMVKQIMPNLNHNNKQSKNFTHRWWQGLLLMLFITVVVIFGSTEVMDRFFDMATAMETIIPTSLILVSTILFFVMFLGFGFGGLVLLFYIMSWMQEGEKEKFTRSTEVLQDTLPQLVPEQETKAIAESFSIKPFIKLVIFMPLFLFFLGLVSIMIKAGFQQVWPSAPDWVPGITFWTLFLASVLLINFGVAKHRAKKGLEKVSAFKTIFLRLISWLFFSIFVFTPLSVLYPYLNQIHPIGSLILHLPIIGITFMVYGFVPYQWVVSALNRGNYDKAIWRSRQMEQLHVFRSMFLYLHGLTLFFAGCYEESKPLLEESIRATRQESGNGGTDGLVHIGSVLTAQGKYDDAIKMFEGAMKISPQGVGVYNALAEVYLIQGINPKRALELTEQALKNYYASSMRKWLEWINQSNCSFIYVNQAWALALLGKHSDASQILERAFAKADNKSVPDFAGLLYRAGQTERLCNNNSEAIEHWHQASRLDPQGHYGRLATQALQKLKTTPHQKQETIK